MATGYVKQWLDKWHDDWWLSLNNSQRGIFYQLIDMAKMQSDDGNIFVTSLNIFAQTLAIDRRTLDKIVTKLRRDERINVTAKNGGINIFVKNYVYWQRVKKIGVNKGDAKMSIDAGKNAHHKINKSTEENNSSYQKNYSRNSTGGDSEPEDFSRAGGAEKSSFDFSKQMKKNQVHLIKQIETTKLWKIWKPEEIADSEWDRILCREINSRYPKLLTRDEYEKVKKSNYFIMSDPETFYEYLESKKHVSKLNGKLLPKRN